MGAFVAGTVYFTGLKPAHSNEADAFTPATPQHKSYSQKDGFFNSKSSNHGSKSGKPNGNGNPGSGPGKPNGNGPGGGDGGPPGFPKVESLEEGKKRIDWLRDELSRLEKETTSDSETEAELEIHESFKLNSALKKVSRNAQKSQRAMKDFEEVKNKLREGNPPMQIGRDTTNLGNNYYYIRKSEARIVVKLDPETGNSDIVAFAMRSNLKNMQTMATVVNTMFDTKIKINSNSY